MPNRREKRKKLSRTRLLRKQKTSLPVEQIMMDVSNPFGLDVDGVPQAGAINAYVCNFCYRLTVVQHVHAGVTPKYMACLATEGCEGTARSMRYPPNPPQKVIDAVRWEWYLPDITEFEDLNSEMKENVLNGGLVLRRKNLDELEKAED